MATNDKPIRLNPDTLRLSADHYYRHFFLDLKCFEPVKVGLEQIFTLRFWSLVHADLKSHDVVRVIGQDRAFDVLITVVEKSATEIVMRPFNYVRPGSEAHKIFERLTQGAEDAAALDAAAKPPAAPMSVAEMIAWNAKTDPALAAKS